MTEREQSVLETDSWLDLLNTFGMESPRTWRLGSITGSANLNINYKACPEFSRVALVLIGRTYTSVPQQAYKMVVALLCVLCF